MAGAAPLRVAAVVVTYHRPAELRLVIEALLGQTRPPDRIVVFDNGGPVAAAEVLREWAGRIDIVRSPANLGGAGGFAGGLRRALDHGADWAWLMDDDAVPKSDALAQLLAVLPGLPERAGALCGAVREYGALAPRHRRRFGHWLGGEWPLGWRHYRRQRAEIDTGSFVGFMVAAEAAREVGLPEAELFLAYDDTEYSLRLRRQGWRLWLVPGSVIEHLRTPHARLRSGSFGAKHYFNIRNRIVVKRRYCRLPLPAVAGAAAFGALLWLACRGWRQPGSLGLLARAVADGVRGRLGPFPGSGR
jgi:GT2 family glycosyltransferase